MALYNDKNELVGYFHDNDEIDKHLEFMKKRDIDTENWKRTPIKFDV